jgi:transposase
MSDTELLHEPKEEPVRRLEVFTGAGRRRAWTAEQKARIIAESCAEGVTVSAVARRHGLTPQQLFGWRRQAQQPGTAATGLSFAPVVVTAAVHARSQRAAVSGVPPIEVVVGSLTVRVPSGADLPTLQVVLRAARTVS